MPACDRQAGKRGKRAGAYLDEADVLGVFPEALPADIEAVLPDQTPLVAADSAAETNKTVSNGLLTQRQMRRDVHFFKV